MSPIYSLLVWLVVGGGMIYVTVLDWKSGEMTLPSRSGARRGKRRQRLRKSEYPLVFVTVLALRVVVAGILILVMTGKL